jgi:hypothetical protein
MNQILWDLTTNIKYKLQLTCNYKFYIFTFSFYTFFLTFKLQEPCVLYIGQVYHYPPDVVFYIFFFNNYKY